MLSILAHAWPPAIDQRRHSGQLFFALRHGGRPLRQLRGVGEGVDGLNVRVQLGFHLGGGLGRGIVDRKRMEREGEGVELLPILLVSRVPIRHLRVVPRHLRRGLPVCLAPRVSLMVLAESVLGFLSLLARLLQSLPQRQRVTFHHVVHEMKKIGHTQALQTLFGALDEGLRPITDHVAHLGLQGVEPLVHEGFPGGRAAIVRRFFQHDLPRCEVQQDQDHTFQERFVYRPADLLTSAHGDPVLLPGRRRLQDRRLQRLHHTA